MFRTVPLTIIRSSSLHTQQWYMSYKFADSLREGSGQNWSGSAQNQFRHYTRINDARSHKHEIH